jgi:hypothetical protein
VEVKLGIHNGARELVVDTDATPDEVRTLVADALAATGGIFELADAKGRRVLVPAERLAYVEIGESTERRVGFSI